MTQTIAAPYQIFDYRVVYSFIESFFDKRNVSQHHALQHTALQHKVLWQLQMWLYLFSYRPIVSILAASGGEQ